MHSNPHPLASLWLHLTRWGTLSFMKLYHHLALLHNLLTVLFAPMVTPWFSSSTPGRVWTVWINNRRDEIFLFLPLSLSSQTVKDNYSPQGSLLDPSSCLSPPSWTFHTQQHSPKPPSSSFWPMIWEWSWVIVFCLSFRLNSRPSWIVSIFSSSGKRKHWKVGG